MYFRSKYIIFITISSFKGISSQQNQKETFRRPRKSLRKLSDFSTVYNNQKKLVQLDLDFHLDEFYYIILKLRLSPQNSEKRLHCFVYSVPANGVISPDFLDI